MPADVSITVAPDVAAIARKLKELDAAGGGRLKNELAAAMRKIGKQFVEAEKASIRGTKVKGVKRNNVVRNKRGLPKGSGQGIREPIARAIVSRNRLTNTKKTVAGIEIRVSSSKMPQGMEKIPSYAQRGLIRHPLFGDRSQWYSQVVTPAAWWSNTGREQLKLAREDLIKVCNDFAKHVV